MGRAGWRSAETHCAEAGDGDAAAATPTRAVCGAGARAHGGGRRRQALGALGGRLNLGAELGLVLDFAEQLVERGLSTRAFRSRARQQTCSMYSGCVSAVAAPSASSQDSASGRSSSTAERGALGSASSSMGDTGARARMGADVDVDAASGVVLMVDGAGEVREREERGPRRAHPQPTFESQAGEAPPGGLACRPRVSMRSSKIEKDTVITPAAFVYSALLCPPTGALASARE